VLDIFQAGVFVISLAAQPQGVKASKAVSQEFLLNA